MRIKLTGRKDHYSYNEEVDEFTSSLSFYELAIRAEEGEDTSSIAGVLTSLMYDSLIYAIGFDDQEWGFSTDHNSWDIEVNASEVPDGVTPVEYIGSLLS